MTKNAAWPEGSFLDSLATGVLATDPKGKIVYANAASEILSGASKNRLLGISAEAVFPSARRWTERFLSDTVRGEPALTERTEMFCPSNPTESRKVRVTVSRFPGTGGILMEVSDLGAVLIAENEAQKVGLSETSRQVLRNLAHEIKNPLGGIRGAAQLLEGELTNPELREYTGVIISEADRLQNLVDRLLAPYRTGRSLSDINIHEVLERVRQIILAEFPKGLSFIRDYDVSVPTLRGDREQLLQVFLNIEKNAAEALDGKIAEGTAEIRVITRVAQQVQIGLRRYRLALSIHIQDNGPGVPPEIRDRIFYPLVTGKANGSGLGLSLAQNFIRQHDGSIDVESEPGKTDFRILLPLSPPETGDISPA